MIDDLWLFIDDLRPIIDDLWLFIDDLQPIIGDLWLYIDDKVKNIHSTYIRKSKY